MGERKALIFELGGRKIAQGAVPPGTVVEDLDVFEYGRLELATGGPGLEACEQGDPAAAAAELARHYGRTAPAVIALMAPEHDPVPLRAALAMVLPDRAPS
jgi:hypothetical protein